MFVRIQPQSLKEYGRHKSLTFLKGEHKRDYVFLNLPVFPLYERGNLPFFKELAPYSDTGEIERD
jgi:hypothetical protein